jgi:flagellum-specific peptidoglycan hydrolase FlgJ
MRLIILLSLLLIASYSWAQRDIPAYIAHYDSVALSIMQTHGIPASFILAIAIHESAAGTSKVSQERCNHFGMKGKKAGAKNKKGYVYKYIDFESAEASYYYFANLVTSKKFYETLKGETDPLKWLKALKRTGYAASSKWVPRIHYIIKKHNLTELDKLLMAESPTPVILNDSLQPTDH